MIRMVKVHRRSMAFCKYTLAAGLWLALLFQLPALLWLMLALLAASAVLGVDKAPLVWLADKMLSRWVKTEEAYVNLYSMRFAHIFAGVMVAVSLVLLTFHYAVAAWILTGLLAVLQSVAACGFCSAAKLYDCLICNTNCCRLGKRIKGKVC